jgi:hypothetical protein
MVRDRGFLVKTGEDQDGGTLSQNTIVTTMYLEITHSIYSMDLEKDHGSPLRNLIESMCMFNQITRQMWISR